MGFTLVIFCYQCKEFIFIHSPDILDENVEALYDGGHNVEMENEIKAEIWGESMNAVSSSR